MTRKANWYLRLGLLLAVVPLGLRRLVLIPDVAQGFCTGLGIVLLMLGAYCTSHRVERLRVRKQRLISSVLRLP
ncbi:MAG TPA: hypothetical protein PLF11_15115 [Bacillota bacterium]|jgi:hypothetical protein|nr:hypothetical protein [Bacillota bacterium]HOI38697.1 hypothetical protein [Bacillota bacterium]